MHTEGAITQATSNVGRIIGGLAGDASTFRLSVLRAHCLHSGDRIGHVNACLLCTSGCTVSLSWFAAHVAHRIDRLLVSLVFWCAIFYSNTQSGLILWSQPIQDTASALSFSILFGLFQGAWTSLADLATMQLVSEADAGYVIA